jgi:hypothetical protein
VVEDRAVDSCLTELAVARELSNPDPCGNCGELSTEVTSLYAWRQSGLWRRVKHLQLGDTVVGAAKPPT